MKKIFILLFILLIFVSGCDLIGDNPGSSNTDHEHKFSTTFSYDDNNHYKVCSCGEKKDVEAHKWDSGKIIKEATENEEGIKQYTCTICGYQRNEVISGSTNSNTEEDDGLTDIERTQKLIAKVFDSFTQEVSKGTNESKKQSRRRSIKGKRMDEVGTTYPGLSGEFTFNYTYGSTNEAFIKTSAEPLSHAFGLLESFIQEGNPLTDFDGNFYFSDSAYYPLFARITKFSDYKNIIAIDYYSYHMIIGLDQNDKGFVYSYSSDFGNTDSEYLQNIHIDYATPDMSMTYWQTTVNWKDEYENIVKLFEEVDELNAIAPKLMRELLTDEKGEELAINPTYDQNNPKHKLLANDNEYSYIGRNHLAALFMYNHYTSLFIDGYDLQATIEGDVLKKIYNFNMLLDVPEGVKKIEDLGIWHSEEELFENFFVYGIFLPSTILEIDEHAFDNVYKMFESKYSNFSVDEYFEKYFDCVFIDSLEKKEQVESVLRQYLPNVKIYYQNEWHVKEGIILPIATISSDECNHVFSNELTYDEKNHYTHCIICGETKTFAHTIETYYELEPTCQNSGVLVHKCAACAYSYKETVEALGHTEGEAVFENVVQVTCTTDGYHDEVIYCTRCNTELSRNHVEDKSVGHVYGDYTYDGDYHFKECTICHNIEEEGKHEFAYSEIRKDATKDECGEMVYKCSVCNCEMVIELPKVSDGSLNVNLSEKYIEYGLYPQTKISDTYLIEQLDNLTNKDKNQYGWYLYQGNYYVKEIAHPLRFAYTFSDDSSIEDGASYWFICKPIKWNILKSENNQYMLLSDALLDVTYYSSKDASWSLGDIEIHIGKYYYSDIRNWLNNDFYLKAFVNDDKYINVTTVDNSADTMNSNDNRGWSPDSDDKVFLLSYQDYTNVNYGFAGNISTNEARSAYATDYAKARGISMIGLTGRYWTRSADKSSPSYVDCIFADGSIDYLHASKTSGVRPAIVVTIEY